MMETSAPLTHSWYFLSYALFATVVGVLMAWAFYMRYKRDGTPINYSILMITGAVALSMWLGVGVTEYLYNNNSLNAGLAAFFVGISIASLFAWIAQRVVRKIENDAKLIRELATHDSLTGLLNLRVFHECLSDEAYRAGRHGQPLALALIDVHDMKRLNAAYGYKGGDIVLRELGLRLQNTLRPSDRACRFDGDKIALILPHIKQDCLEELANRITGMLLENPVEMGDGQRQKVSLSMGVVCAPQGGKAGPLIDAAHRALKNAIDQGRDRACVQTFDGEPAVYSRHPRALSASPA